MFDNFKKIIVVGVGGTGSFLLPPLIRYLNSRTDVNSSIDIVLIDGDKYDVNNISRQEFAHSLLGKNKAEVQAAMYCKKFSELSIYPVGDYLGKDNIDIISEGSIVFCCVDNHFCRHLISDRCKELNNVLLISGGNEEYDGNVQSYFKFEGKEYNSPIENRHPEIKEDTNGDRSVMSCEQLAQLPGGGQVIFANLFSATLMACLFYSYVDGTTAPYQIDDIFFDAKQVKSVVVKNGRYQ